MKAYRRGDFSARIPEELTGLPGKIADALTEMIDMSSVTITEFERVARLVGKQGKGSERVGPPMMRGSWERLVDSSNAMAYDLVSPMNEMIGNLRETTRQNAEQDWLKTNLAKFKRLLQGQRDLTSVSELMLSELTPLINAQRGGFYMMDESEYDNPKLKLPSAYAYNDHVRHEWRLKEGLIGQCAFEKKRILLTDIPSGYLEINPGLGAASPLNIIVLPIIFENRVKAVVETASFNIYNAIHQSFLNQLSESIGIVLNTIKKICAWKDC